jgi:hypothetical protein
MRAWHELVATIGDLVPGGVPGLGLLLVLLTALVAFLWYWWPEWWHGLRRGAVGLAAAASRTATRIADLVTGRSGRRWPKVGRLWGRWRLTWSRWRLRWRWRRRPGSDPADEPADLPPDQLPELPAVALTRSADELAAQGRFKEAVRERLRAIVRDLVDRQVLEYRPGWTVTELAAMAGRARPAAAASLAGASEVFSSIWYGQREALAADDAAMREYAAQVRAALADQRAAV